MIDKTRQRHRLTPAPQGYLPNWVVALLAVAVVTIGVLLNQLV